MLDVAIDCETGERINARDARKGKKYKCPYCGTVMHVCHARNSDFFVRNDNQKPHPQGKRCYLLVNQSPPERIVRKLQKTSKKDLFGAIEGNHDRIPRDEPESEPEFEPETEPDFESEPVIPGEQDTLPMLRVNDFAERGVPEDDGPLSAMQESLERAQDYEITHLRPTPDTLRELDIQPEEYEHLSNVLQEHEDDVSVRDIEVLDKLIDREMHRAVIVERPYRSLRQFNRDGLFFLPPDTQFNGCILKDIFLSYREEDYRDIIKNQKETLRKRILYCRAKRLTYQCEEREMPSVDFSMFWPEDGEKYYINLRMYFPDGDGYTGQERYEFFLGKHYKAVDSDGKQKYIPKPAKDENDKEKFDALLYGDWRFVSEKTEGKKHYLNFKTNYINAKQLLFVDGYNG